MLRPCDRDQRSENSTEHAERGRVAVSGVRRGREILLYLLDVNNNLNLGKLMLQAPLRGAGHRSSSQKLKPWA
jgi:hypothetical protein